MKQKKSIAILGSTGSIGTQALDIIATHSDRFELFAITGHNNIDLLIRQAKRFKPEIVATANPTHYLTLKEALKSLPIKVFAGMDAICQIVEMQPIDTVLTAMVGYAGLQPTIHAIKAKKCIALANKETLVVAGDIILQLAQEYNTPIIPVDSEHSAIFQCLAGEGNNPISKVILTASGGPFRKHTMQQLKKVTLQEALKHPNWDMGAKITIDSATMMNKGFEVIEAKWLFGLQPEQIEVIVHPQSIVHSMVEFADTSIKAQLGLPDMWLPILYAFTYPERIATQRPTLDFEEYANLSFEKPDTEKFRHLQLAYQAMEKGGNVACTLNAANEVVVQAFLKEEIDFLSMGHIIEEVISQSTFVALPTYNDYVQTDKEARFLTKTIIQKNKK